MLTVGTVPRRAALRTLYAASIDALESGWAVHVAHAALAHADAADTAEPVVAVCFVEAFGERQTLARDAKREPVTVCVGRTLFVGYVLGSVDADVPAHAGAFDTALSVRALLVRSALRRRGVRFSGGPRRIRSARRKGDDENEGTQTLDHRLRYRVRRESESDRMDTCDRSMQKTCHWFTGAWFNKNNDMAPVRS